MQRMGKPADARADNEEIEIALHGLAPWVPMHYDATHQPEQAAATPCLRLRAQ